MQHEGNNWAIARKTLLAIGKRAQWRICRKNEVQIICGNSWTSNKGAKKSNNHIKCGETENLVEMVSSHPPRTPKSKTKTHNKKEKKNFEITENMNNTTQHGAISENMFWDNNNSGC